jgi:hypothetical protein
MIHVECTATSTGELEPSAVSFGSRRVEVLAITDRWYANDQKWWKVETEEGAYVLRLDETSGTWELAAVVGR